MDEIITITDVRNAGFCARGIYGLAKQKGWSNEDFRNFVKNGARVSDLRLMNEDALIDRVLEVKRKNQNG
jgi:hypothetical protein